jgi:hypothetical protein
MSDPELKPCPFCGGECRVEKRGSGWTALCGECYVAQDGTFISMDESALRWNTRADGQCGHMDEFKQRCQFPEGHLCQCLFPQQRNAAFPASPLSPVIEQMEFGGQKRESL